MKKFFGWLAQQAPSLTLGNKWVSRWYHSNGIYKYPIGTKIVLKDKRFFGYGEDPEFLIIGYRPISFHEDGYLIERIQDGKTREQIHFKWNIEFHFKPKGEIFSKSHLIKRFVFLLLFVVVSTSAIDYVSGRFSWEKMPMELALDFFSSSFVLFFWCCVEYVFQKKRRS